MVYRARSWVQIMMMMMMILRGEMGIVEVLRQLMCNLRPWMDKQTEFGS